VDAKFSVAVADSIPVHAQAWALPESSAISCAPPEQYQRTSISCLPQKASADLVLPLNISTIDLAIIGLVLMSVIVLSATALGSVVILGTLDWTWVLPVGGLWLLLLCGFAATMHRGGVKRHGKGKQKMTVEPVHVHSGGQAIVGAVAAPGGGIASKDEEPPHAKQLAYAQEPPLPRADAAREPVSVASDGERALPDARRSLNRRTEG
jgi:hypothetical protein